MKVLIIGSGGREHALCWKVAQSKKTSKVFCAPGNGGTGLVAENINIEANNIKGLLEFALEEGIDLTIVGPEEPLTLGIVDRFKGKGLKIFGPEKSASKLEASKDFSKQFMNKYGIPTPRYQAFVKLEDAKSALEEFNYPLVVKADGLCAGKGVYICGSRNEAVGVINNIMEEKCFGDQGDKIIIEEFIEGEEVSLLCLVSGSKIVPMESAKDYKKIKDGDEGLNTGGVGAYSPSGIMTEKMKGRINQEILEPISNGLAAEGLEFTGVLFIGFMIDGDDIRVLEFNVRFGDPETESVIVRLESDLVDIILKTISKNICLEDLIWTKEHSVCLVATSKGYPLNYEKNYEILGLEEIDKSTVIFHNGTELKASKTFTNSGRVLTLCSLGINRNVARDRVYQEVEKINYKNIYFRKDIGKY